MKKTDIFITADEVWDFFENNKKRLKSEMVLIAENQFYPWFIFLTEQNGFPLLIVKSKEDEPIETVPCYTPDKTELLTEILYESYIYLHEQAYPGIGEDEPAEEDDEESDDDIVYEREDELKQAFLDFVQVVLGVDRDEIKGSTYEDLYEDMLDLIGKSFPDIYRPLMLLDTSGNEEMIKYPYKT